MTNGGPDSQWKRSDFLNLGALGFGSTAFSTSLGTVVLPVLVLAVAPEDLKNTYLGLLTLVGLVVAMVMQPLAGHLSDLTLSPWGRRTPYLAVGSLLACLSVFILGIASSIMAMAVAIIVIQVCINLALGPYQALIRDLAPEGRRGEVASFKVLADSVGGVTFLVLVALLLGLYTSTQNDLWLWLSLGLMSLSFGVSAAWTVIGIRKKETGIAPVAVVSDTGRVPGEAHPQFGWFLGSRFCTFAALAALQTYAVFYLRDVVGLENPARAVGTMTLVIGGSLLLVVYPIGKLSDRIGRKNVIVASALVGAIGIVALLQATNLLQVMVVSSLLGVCAGAYLGTSLALATDLVSSGGTARQMGIANAAAVGGAALARLAGPGVDLLNRAGEGLGYSVLLDGCAIFFVLGALLIIPIREGATSLSR
ncbi:MAG: MFS transporter [Dehalococcoidia bacterium]